MSSGIPRIVLALCILHIAPFIHAADSGWLVGLSAGTAEDDQLNEKETGYKAYVGYRFMDHLSGEIAYVDFGKYYNNTVDRAGVSIHAAGIYPINSYFNIFAKAGVYHWTVEIDLNPGTVEEDGGDFTYGLGAQYNFTDKLGIRAEYEEYLDFADFDISLLTLGLVFNF
jgi:outer membrane autotransporter protein